MALTASVSPYGLEVDHYTNENEILYVPVTVAASVTRNCQMYYAQGSTTPALSVSGSSVQNSIGRAERTFTGAPITVGFPYSKDFDPAAVDAATENATLVGIHPNVPEGLPVFKATFTGHQEDSITGYTAATPTMTVTGLTTNYEANAIVYIYAGQGAGQINVICSTSSGVCTLLRKFKTAPATDGTSKVIILAGEAATYKGISFFGHVDMGSAGATVVVSDGADDGMWVVYMDWRRAAALLNNLTLLIVPARYLLPIS